MKFLRMLVIIGGASIASAQQSTPRTVLIPRDTGLKFAVAQPIDPATARRGDDVRLRLVRPLVIDGIPILQPGFEAHGKVTNVLRAGSKCKNGLVHWTVNRVIFPDGTAAQTQLMRFTTSDGVPEIYPDGWVFRGRRHNYAELFENSPLLIAALPQLLVLGVTGRLHPPCILPYGDPFKPAGSIVGVAVTKDHRVWL